MNKPENIDRLIVLYLEGKASREEIDELLKWLGSTGENKKYYQKIKNIWEVSGNMQKKGEIEPDKALMKVLERISKREKGPRLWEYFQKIAAVLLFPVLLGSFFLGKNTSTAYSVKHTLVQTKAPLGIRTSIELSDGSKVWLNAGSTIKYPQVFGKDRTVYLKGEAYFEVSSNASSPFTVKTEHGSIQATGTKFNVKEFCEGQKLSVTLKEGKVKVCNSRHQQQNIELSPSQHLVINTKSGKTTLTTGNIDNYIAWKEGILIFRNVSMDEVLTEISRYYNVDIELEDEELKEYRYRATFDNESLEEILKLIRYTSPIDYRILARKQKPTGLYTRKKIIIFKKTPN